MQLLSRAEQAFREGNFALAGRLLARVLAAQPSHSRANELIAYVAARRGDEEALARHLAIATASANASATSWFYLGALHLQKNRVGDAEAAFGKAVALEPRFFEAWHELGRALHEKGDYQAASSAFERAIALKPGSYEAHHNAGRALYAQGRLEDALACYDRAIAIDASSADTWLNRGEVLHDLDRMDLALQAYATAQALRPGFHEARANEALTRLILGDWDVGWDAFESRWSGAAALRRRHKDVPQWRGETSLEGKRLLVWCEQGYGDTLQFCRFLPRLMQTAGSVVFEVQRDLQPLLQANFGCDVVAQGAEVGPCDFQIALMSVPFALHTTPQTLPGVPYLHADPQRLERWRSRVARPQARPKVAIACSGRSTYKHDARRNVALADFAVLAPWCDLFLVQKELANEDRELLDDGRIAIDFLGGEIEDFRDGAAIVAHMDLVISVDTSLAHLAGAMARPLWVVLAHVPDWRWMREREDSPWYPTATIFRQREPGDWEGVFDRVRKRFEDGLVQPSP